MVEALSVACGDELEPPEELEPSDQEGFGSRSGLLFPSEDDTEACSA